MNNSKYLKSNNSQNLPIKIEFHSYITDDEQKKANNLFDILTRSFRPIVDSAYKKYLKDQYAEIVHKVETERLQVTGKKSEFEKIYERLFKKSLTKNFKKSKSQIKNSNNNNNNLTNSASKTNAFKRQQSFLIENKIINKKDILNNPCNQNLLRICHTPDSTVSRKKALYDREILMQKAYEDKKTKMRIENEQKTLSELKPFPGMNLESQRIIAQNAHLEERAPLHLRSTEVLQQKSLRLKSLCSELKREYSAKSIGKTKSLSSNNLNLMENIRDNRANINCKANYSTNNINANIYLNNNYNTYNNIKSLSRARSANAKDFNEWLDSKHLWLKNKESKTQDMRNAFINLRKEMEEKYTTFTPSIDAKSEFIAKLKSENENSNKKIYEKLYGLKNLKKEKIQILQQKYKPTFKPNVNKFPQYLLNNSTNQTTFFVEEKEDDYANFALSAKSKGANNNKTDFSGTTRTGSKINRKSRESNEFGKFKKNVENNFYLDKNKRNYKKSQKEVEEFFSKMNKGQSPNLVLEVEDIKFYNSNSVSNNTNNYSGLKKN